MPVYKAWFKGKEGDVGQGRFDVIDVAQPFEALCAAMDADRRIAGERLLAQRDPDVRGVMRVKWRLPTTFLGGAIDRIEVASERYVDEAAA